MTRTLALLAAMAFATPALAAEDSSSAGWSCRNVDFEISCDEEKCEAAEAHTPMAIDLHENRMSACAYSGCWAGVPDVVVRSGRFETHAASDLPFSTAADADMAADVSATIDIQSGTGTILVAGLYAHPMICEAR